MKVSRFRILMVMLLVISLLSAFALSCGGSRSSNTQEEGNPEANADLDKAYSLMTQTQIAPNFGKSLGGFDSSKTNTLLPTPDTLVTGSYPDGKTNYEKFDEAIGSINNAINLINAARKANYTADNGQKAYINFVIGYLYTLSAASRLINSPLGKNVISFSNGQYGIALEDTNGNGKGLDDLSGTTKTEESAKKSAQAIIDALYLLTGRKFKLVTSAKVGSETWNIDVQTSSDLVKLFPNTTADPDHTGHKGTHNALHHFARTFEILTIAVTYPDVRNQITKINSYIEAFDNGLKLKAIEFGFSEITE